MKASTIRRVRRRTTSGRDAGIFRKESQEQSFFSTSAQEPFFQPSPVVQRKEEPVKEEEKIQRAEDKKEEEQVQRAEDKKEEEQVQRAEDKKEEEQVQRVEDKKEEE